MAPAQLRLGATFDDKATPGIKRLRREIAESARKTPAMAELTKWFDEVGHGASGFVRSAGDVPGIINAMGIGSLTAAASVADLVSCDDQLRLAASTRPCIRKLSNARSRSEP